ncbi:metal-sensitive transcriptional regulator [Halobacillus massiliensis]|uniref:metal-sensitive transcriptional regulator n=1 Tax=Halobacillus massiliensis TaxID=1926286 RepID=UPI0009E33A66|nr:metal-sensitive transcriptional regulator [Halobacillus massiliensis]
MEYNTAVKNRIKRMEGQLRGVLKMMEEGKDCKDVIAQLSAARSGLDRTIGLVVSENLAACIQEAEDEETKEESINEAVHLLVRSR